MKFFKSHLLLLFLLTLSPVFSNSTKDARENRLKTQSRKTMHVIENEAAHSANNNQHYDQTYLNHIAEQNAVENKKIVIDSNHPCYANCMSAHNQHNQPYTHNQVGQYGVQYTHVPQNQNFSHNINTYEPKGFIGSIYNGLNSVLVGGTALAGNTMMATSQMNANLMQAENNLKQHQEAMDAQNRMNEMKLKGKVAEEQMHVNQNIVSSIQQGPYTTKNNGYYYAGSGNQVPVNHNYHPDTNVHYVTQPTSKVYYKKNI